MKKVELLSTVYGNFNDAVNEDSMGSIPPIGMGYIYRATVKRAGLEDAHYIGLTTRSIGDRRKEHINNAAKLGVLNPQRISNYEKTHGYKNADDTNAAPMYAVMRTAMGTRQTITERVSNPEYFEMGRLGQGISLHGLGVAEGLLIKQSQRTGYHNQPGTMNYHTLRHSHSMNVGRGGLGLALKNYAKAELAVSAYIYLKYESAEVMRNEEELIDRIVELTYGKKKAGNRNYVLHYLQSYLRFGDEMQASLWKHNYRNLSTLKQQIEAVTRPRGERSIGGVSGDEIRDTIRNVEGMGNIKLTSIGLWDAFNDRPSAAALPNQDETVNAIAGVMIDSIMESIYHTVGKYSKRKPK